MPFTSMPSGHHQVADAISDYVKKRKPAWNCKKINFLSTLNPAAEKAGIQVYLKWIDMAPRSYNRLYARFGYTRSPKDASVLKWSHRLLMTPLERILCEEEPDLVVCTHGFSSFLMNALKKQMRCRVPVVNVCTDFFMNDFWGRTDIDHHFVPHRAVKRTLIDEHGVPPSRITVAGIPVHEKFSQRIEARTHTPPYRILISGGNQGLLDVSSLFSDSNQPSVQYLVLCGNNAKLYEKLARTRLWNVQPLAYVHSKAKMNALYDQADAIVTKPGGVTISEAFRKRLPIFIHHALPGQEQVNLAYLCREHVVWPLHDRKPLDRQILTVFKDPAKLSVLQYGMQRHLNDIDADGCQAVIDYASQLVDARKPAATKN
ncbi:MAG TPA: galactosyldiacylglycerol synthase [Bacillales bacterium]|nr:galactosyldiacylglycerol synthase [Bacillales bacterium]